VITDEYVHGWTDLDDSDGELGAVFDDLGAPWAEAILTADLTPAERQTWAERLAEWQAETADYGIDTAFEAAQAAAVQGWDDAGLQRMLRGEAASSQSEAAWAEPTLAIAD
jgi:sugar phosphate isomerase/epimerase